MASWISIWTAVAPHVLMQLHVGCIAFWSLVVAASERISAPPNTQSMGEGDGRVARPGSRYGARKTSEARQASIGLSLAWTVVAFGHFVIAFYARELA